MKKLVLFLSASLLLFLACITMHTHLSRPGEFELQDEKGKQAALKDLTIEATTYSYVGKTMKMTLQNGTMRGRVSRSYDRITTETTLPYDRKFVYDKDDPNSYSEPDYRVIQEDSSEPYGQRIEERKVKAATCVYYFFNTTKANKIEIKNQDFVSNEKLYLVEVRHYEEGEKQPSYVETILRSNDETEVSEQDSIVRVQTSKNKGEYYLLPFTTLQYEGENKLYRIDYEINRSKDFSHDENQDVTKVEAIQGLPKGRTQEALWLMKDQQLLVISHDDKKEKTYISRYQKTGALEKELALNGAIPLENSTYFENENYLGFTQDDKIYIIDSKAMKLIETIDLTTLYDHKGCTLSDLFQQEYLFISDIYYQKGKVFLIYMGNGYAKIYQIVNHQIVYQGNWDLGGHQSAIDEGGGYRMLFESIRIRR